MRKESIRNLLTSLQKLRRVNIYSWQVGDSGGSMAQFCLGSEGLRTRRAAAQTSRTNQPTNKQNQLVIQDSQRAKLSLQAQRQEKTNVSTRRAEQENFLLVFSGQVSLGWRVSPTRRVIPLTSLLIQTLIVSRRGHTTHLE